MSAPDFVIAGAYRSGTTTLRHWIAQHPSVFMAPLAEPSFFAFDNGRYPEHMLEGADDPFRRRRTETLSEYQQLFREAPEHAVVGECSPEYLRAPGSAARLFRHNPECRAVISLRHPVDRFISDWKMCRRDGVEDLELSNAVLALSDRRSRGAFGGHYEQTSRYSDGLAEFLGAFPKEQILVLIQERWSSAPEVCAHELGSFLDIDQSLFPSSLHAANRGGVPTGLVGSLLWKWRRMAAPVLAGRVPRRIQEPLDRRLAGLLETRVTETDRAPIETLLRNEVERVRALIDDDVPEWD